MTSIECEAQIVETWQDQSCATGDYKVRDEHGRVWTVSNVYSNAQIMPVTGRVHGLVQGRYIVPLRGR